MKIFKIKFWFVYLFPYVISEWRPESIEKRSAHFSPFLRFVTYFVNLITKKKKENTRCLWKFDLLLILGVWHWFVTNKQTQRTGSILWIFLCEVCSKEEEKNQRKSWLDFFRTNLNSSVQFCVYRMDFRLGCFVRLFCFVFYV